MRVVAGLQEEVHAAVLSDDAGFVIRIAGQPQISHVTHFLVCAGLGHSCRLALI